MTEEEKGASKISHPWSSEALLAKAQRYADEMAASSSKDWQFGLLSTFVLEFLARAALAEISPTLLAETKDWNNIYFALGHAPKVAKFVPKSIDTKSVIARLGAIIPDFNPEQSFAERHIADRNEELHSGGTPFDSADPAWLGHFYQTCKVLLLSLDEDLSSLFGADEAKAAEALITAFLDESAKAVMKIIAEHKRLWDARSEADRTEAAQKAFVWSTRERGHRAKCPSCNSDALLAGNAISEPEQTIEGDLIVETQRMLPAIFECVACRLKISGLPQLNACGLGAPYKSTSIYNAADFYAEQYGGGFEDDNNEY
jgi:hypothetical protein